MMTYEDALKLIEFQAQQINDLTAERDRLKAESENSGEALSDSHMVNHELSTKVNDATESMQILGIEIWTVGVAYSSGETIQYKSALYECIQSHTSQPDWCPDVTAALWKRRYLEEWPEWVQPEGAHNAYKLGAKCSHNGKHWTSDIADNVYEPGVAYWTEA